jgi:hypothetical protein
MFRDQNFVSSLKCKNENCIHIVRVENASLRELAEMAKEIFCDAIFPEGSILLFGSVSHLARSGTSVYAREWTELVAATSSHWRGIRICSLIPVIVAECQGSIVREIRELAVWYQTVYDSDPQGMSESWMGAVVALEACSIGATQLEVMESYKVALPSTQQCLTIDSTITFCSNNSRPVTCTGLSKDRCCELLGSLPNCLFSNFRACASPEEYLVREDGKDKLSEKGSEQRIVLVGASNLDTQCPILPAQI